MSVTVGLTAVSGRTITFTAASANGTATAGSDYTALAPKTFSIPAGQTFVTFTTPLTNDTVAEGFEHFFVDISAPANATVTDGRGQVTIEDNDV